VSSRGESLLHFLDKLISFIIGLAVASGSGEALKSRELLETHSVGFGSTIGSVFIGLGGLGWYDGDVCGAPKWLPWYTGDTEE